MVTVPIGSSAYLQPYWDAAGVPTTTMLQMSAGFLANGLLNGKQYINGVVVP